MTAKMEKMLKEQKDQIERQFEVRLEKLILEQSNQVEKLRTDSKVESKLGNMLIDNTAKFEQLFKDLKNQMDKNHEVWQSRCDTASKLQQEVNEVTQKISLLQKTISQDSFRLDRLDASTEKFDSMFDKNENTITELLAKLERTIEDHELTKKLYTDYKQGAGKDTVMLKNEINYLSGRITSLQD